MTSPNASLANALAEHNLALSLRELGRVVEAEAAFRRALAIAPDAAATQTSLGNLLKSLGRFDEAIALQTTAAEANPGVEGLWRNLRLTYQAAGRSDAGREALTAAAARWPSNAPVRDALAALCLASGQFEAAATAAREALALAPSLVSARVSLASASKESGDLDAAIALLNDALALDAQHADARWNLALAQLQAGQWAHGWAGLEWRRRIEGLRPRLLPGVPEWDGARMDPGSRLLLVPEQGLGDTIQFVRYAAIARDRRAHVVIDSPPALARLLRGADGVADVAVDRGSLTAQAPMFSLPALCGPPPTGIHAPPSYLQPEPALVEKWRARVRRGEPGLRVAIAWQGNPGYRADARRSIGLGPLLPLADLPGVQLLSLQRGAGAEQLIAAGDSARAIDPLASELDLGPDAFVDTAAALMHVDLLITSDTALPHLAGALGRPVWLLLSHVPDWRWGTAGDTTPFYPHTRLFRQRRPGDWVDVVDRVAAALRTHRSA